MDLSKKDAEQIATKLNADVKHGGKHTKAVIFYNGREVTRDNIRHGSSSKHNYLPTHLRLSAGQTRDLARCRISKADYFQMLAEKELLPP